MNTTPSVAAARGLLPGSRVQGTFRPPGSKSIAQRALVAAGLCDGETTVRGLPDGEDVRACLDLVRAWGARVTEEGEDAVRVQGVRPGRLTPPERVSFGESGTLARFAAAVLGLCSPEGRAILLEAHGSLSRRGSRPLFAALEAAGVTVEVPESTWPVRIVPAVPPARFDLAQPVSSQEVSGLWIALGALEWPHTVAVHGIIPSRPYLAITRAVLERFGVSVTGQPGDRGTVEFTVSGPLHAPRAAIEVEADASSAAVALGAACLSGGALEVTGIGHDSPQGDVRILDHLAAFGCEVHRTETGLAARGFPTHGAELDLSGEPDLAPVLAVVAAGAALSHGATSELAGLGALPVKESDRIACLADGLRGAGLAVEAGPEQLCIGPPDGGDEAGVDELELDPQGDHRMAFAFALLGLLRPGVRVLDPGCVGKSWPGFWEDLARLGAEVRSA